MREFLHVNDLAEACIHVLEKWSPKQEEISFLNVGTGKDITIKELTNLIAELIGYKGDIKWDISHLDGTPRKLLDISKILSQFFNVDNL